mgnify:CR=1 FL=1
MSRFSFLFCLAPILLFGSIGGFFYAYSVSVMQGLDSLPEIEAIHAMQKLNQGTRNMVFLFTFLVTPLFTLGCAAVLYLSGRQTAGLLLLAAVMVYFLGSFLPTVNINVPMNHVLEALDPAKILPSEAPEIWRRFHQDWTFWNTVRAVMALIALMFSGLAMYSLPRDSAQPG